MNRPSKGPAHRRTWLRRLAAGAVVSALLGAGALWFALLSPFGYRAPEGLAAIDETRTHRVFAYGTLRNPVVRRVVVGRWTHALSSSLPDHRRVALDVLPEPGARTDGLTFEVSAEELRRLDRYERVGIRYERIEKRLDDGQNAWVYRRIAH